MESILPIALLFVSTSIGSALVALALMSFLPGRAAPRRLADSGPELEETAFLFDTRSLIDATAPARALLDSLPPGASDWDRLSAFLRPRFPEFDTEMQELARAGRIELSGPGPAPLRLRAENVAGLARITLADPRTEGPAIRVDSLSLRAMEDELTELRELADEVPILSWRLDAEGRLVWANRAYLLAAADVGQRPPAEGEAPEPEGEMPRDLWPPPLLFETAPVPGDRPVRLQIAGSAGTHRGWHLCSAHPAPDGGWLHFAQGADALVTAERALKDFIQTLTRTFAQLPIALAIFDHERRLALFNPALTDLTGLKPKFLAERPTLGTVLDRLREERMLPEPRNYRSWHRQMVEIERAAAQGFYQDTWQISSGETFRVTARPHADGGLALMIEDITGEMTLTRRFRGEIELGRAVIDRIDEAVAVFAPTGELVIANPAYRLLWDCSGAPEARDAAAALAGWQERGLPGPLWSEIGERLSRDGPRLPWSGALALRDGRRLTMRVEPLSGGTTMVGFSERLATGPLGLAPGAEVAIPGLAEAAAEPPLPPGHHGQNGRY
ncbi:PAS-domain containing protein [Frigidibacter sp. MR17.14]|uniref:PAS-domain containing protein n=1 Tax=Frigidibacter sp. MR17.14 TaxID=3126509 RepID=UPI003012AC4D